MLEVNKDIINFKSYVYEGLDGMKMGYIINVGNNFIGMVECDGMCLISVVMGIDFEFVCFREMKKVLDYGYNNFEVK